MSRKLKSAYRTFSRLDQELKSLDRELESDSGEAGTAFRHRQQLIEEWKASCTDVRAAVQEGREGIGEFGMSLRRGRASTDMKELMQWVEENDLLEDLLEEEVLTYKVDLRKLEQSLSHREFDEVYKLAVTRHPDVVVVDGPKPDDLL